MDRTPLKFKELFELVKRHLDKPVFVSAGCDDGGNADFEPLMAGSHQLTFGEFILRGTAEQPVMVSGETVGFGGKPVYEVIRADDPSIAAADPVFHVGAADCPVLIFDDDF